MRTTHASLSIGTLALTVLLLSCAPQVPPEEANKMPAPEEAMRPEHILITEADIVWNDAPPILPAGAKVAVLEGDPSASGPFTLRLQLPADYRIAPHFHPADEHVTVITGTFAIGMGEVFDEAALEDLGVGGFAMMKKGVKHFARILDGAVIQLHGIGPWGLTYVNEADDPRNP